MAVSFNIPKSPAKSVIQIENFLGADFTNSAANMDTGKSPNCINMIRDVPGKVRKCMGYETVETFSETEIVGGFTQTAFCENQEGTIENESVIESRYVYSNPTVSISEDANHLGTLDCSFTCQAIYPPEVVDVVYLRFRSTYSQWANASDEDRQKITNIFDAYNGNTEISIPASDISYSITGTGMPPASQSLLDLEVGLEKAYDDGHDYIRLVFTFSLVNLAFLDNDPITFTVSVSDLAIDKVVTNSAKINGFHKLRKEDIGVYHIGTCFIRGHKILYTDANDARSKSWEFDEHLYILDGKKMLRYGVTEPQSDIRFRATKEYNRVVVDESVSLTIRAFSKKQYSISITSKSTTSSNGKFTVSKDKKSIVYSDKLTYVGQDVSYSCSFKYKSSETGSWKTGSISTHHLLGISGEGEYSVDPVEEDAYIPVVTISKNPGEGGTPHDPLNLLTPWFSEEFLADGDSKVYHSSFTDWDEVEPIVEILNFTTGEWVEQAEGTYSVNYAEGTVTFGAAPPAPSLEGQDNVRITASRTVERYVDRINHCTFGILYGVNGAQDRLFVSGNPDYKNYDFYSQKDDPTYFGDTSYSYLGTSASAIVGYSVISNYLATHKDKFERDQNIILREGDMIDSKPSFRIINTLQGAGAVAPYSFAYLATEPIFLTEQGVFAVTAQDITGEKYAQDRSFFLNGALLKEENLQDAYACVFNDMYWLCLNDKAYILDGLQAIRTDRSDPYATRQYAGFYRENLPARVMWEDGGRLFFGTEDGKVCRFFNNKYANSSYNDNGEPIIASWETPDINGQVFFKNKTLRHIAIKLDSSIATSVKIYVLDRGLYNFVKEDDTIRELWEHVNTDTTSALYFSFANLIFSRLSFSTDKTQHTLPTKVRVKKVDKFRVKFVNDALNEPFAIFNVGFEYIERNNYKG